MKITLSFHVLLLCLIGAKAGKSSHYRLQQNVDINAAIKNNSFIGSTRKQEELLCCAECNKYDNCISVTFNKPMNVTNNCYLYSQRFNSSDIISSIAINLYTKKSKLINFIYYLQLFLYPQYVIVMSEGKELWKNILQFYLQFYIFLIVFALFNLFNI